MDNPRTAWRLQASILLTDGPVASNQSLPNQLDNTAGSHLRSRHWKDLCGLPDIAINGEK